MTRRGGRVRGCRRKCKRWVPVHIASTGVVACLSRCIYLARGGGAFWAPAPVGLLRRTLVQGTSSRRPWLSPAPVRRLRPGLRFLARSTPPQSIAPPTRVLPPAPAGVAVARGERGDSSACGPQWPASDLADQVFFLCLQPEYTVEGAEDNGCRRPLCGSTTQGEVFRRSVPQLSAGGRWSNSGRRGPGTVADAPRMTASPAAPHPSVARFHPRQLHAPRQQLDARPRPCATPSAAVVQTPPCVAPRCIPGWCERCPRVAPSSAGRLPDLLVAPACPPDVPPSRLALASPSRSGHGARGDRRGGDAPPSVG